MKHFYFHLRDDLDAFDYEGMDFPDLRAAEAYAVKNARGIAAAQVLEGRLNLNHRIEVADESGAVLRTVRFLDVVAVTT